MPAVAPGSKVLISGANGYIGIWVVRTLLEKGYAVRGTVRTVEKGRHLEDSFRSYGDKFEVVVVEDITKDGAFDEASEGVDAIEHLASPCHIKADDPQEMIGPAVRGTVNILESALKNRQNIKRVVITASTASVDNLTTYEEPRVFSELDWNTLSVKEVEEHGREASGISKYRASKTLAERGRPFFYKTTVLIPAWEVYEKHKGKMGWDLVVINPPAVFGPAIHEVSSPDSLGFTARHFYDIVMEYGLSQSKNALATEGNSWVDVRDVGEAHVLVLEKEAAGGERFIISAGSYVWQDLIDVANSLSPMPLPSHDLPRGFPGAGRNAVTFIQFNAAKAARILGIKYKAKADMVRDTLADYEARGW